MKITWLGQAGLLFEHNGKKIIVDPYLSDSCRKVNPKSVRRYPVDEKYLQAEPDVLVLTHDHLDHTDPETLEHYLSRDKSITVLASYNAWNHVRKMGGSHNYVMFNAGTEFTAGGICFRAVYAEHSDLYAIGIWFEVEGKTYYVTGDTLYNTKIFPQLPDKLDYLFAPVNGKGNNMTFTDAKRFKEMCGAKILVPLHWGLFDDIQKSDLMGDGICPIDPYTKL